MPEQDLIEVHGWQCASGQEKEFRNQKIMVVVFFFMAAFLVLMGAYSSIRMGLTSLVANATMFVVLKDFFRSAFPKKVHIYSDHVIVDGRCIKKDQIENLYPLGFCYNTLFYDEIMYAYKFKLKKPVTGISRYVYFAVVFPGFNREAAKKNIPVLLQLFTSNHAKISTTDVYNFEKIGRAVVAAFVMMIASHIFISIVKDFFAMFMRV